MEYDANSAHYTSAKEVIKLLGSSMDNGLTSSVVKKRHEQFGQNTIEDKKQIDPLKIFISQFKSFVIFILIVAAAISYLIGESLDAAVIIVIVILNASFGFVQEYRAEKSIEALRKLAALKANVVRDSEEREIDSQDLVPGDIILLETGDKVPADARLLSSFALQVDESMMTGESVPAKKSCGQIKQTPTISAQINMVFMGTVITKGHAKAIITSIGMQTQMGSIATMIEEHEKEITPLQRKLDKFGYHIGLITIGICALIFLVGFGRDYLVSGQISIDAMGVLFLAAVALAVAAIPEGLPAIVTITLGVGIQKMAKKNALIRKLASVETLGSCDVICTDKTGTLTTNQMTVRTVCTPDFCAQISGEGYVPSGKITSAGKNTSKNLKLLFQIGCLCNDARLIKRKKYEVHGDPTEGALIVSGAKAGLSKASLEKKYPRISEIPFDTQRKRMTTIHKDGRNLIAYTKGAPDIILQKCKYLQSGAKVVRLTKSHRKKILEQNKQMAEKALRVLAFSYKKVGKRDSDSKIESSQIFVGLQGMIDPPRPEVRDAIDLCRQAGIRTVMITGDFKDTAIAIAKELGIFLQGELAIDGEQLSRMSDKVLASQIDKIRIFARASSKHKTRILQALKNRGHIVAMTGDGINDAPALKNADIGIAMGISGTDVAKEASDMILTDDNFASITKAVEQGRHIYNSISQFVQYTLSSNLGEILAIFIALMIGWPLPLIAIQILWINLLTDGLPGLALGLDSDPTPVMNRPPRKKGASILSAPAVSKILLVGTIIGGVTLLVFNFYGRGSEKSISAAFTTLIMAQMFHILTYRMRGFVPKLGKNKYLIGAILLTVLLQIVVLYTPLSVVFKTTALSLWDWVFILAASSTAYLIPEGARILISKFRDEEVYS